MIPHAQLDAYAGYDAEYGHNLANHLPMAIVALARLGASEPRMTAFAATYAQQLHPLPAEQPWPAGDAWPGRLGDPRAWPMYRALFREWLAHEGAADVLSQTLPMLMRGCGAAAFHALIRAGYAVDAGRVGELADALAYWAARWFTVGEPSPDGAASDPASVLLDLRGIARPPQGLIADRMAAAAQYAAFLPAAAALRIDDADAALQRLATLAAQLYAQSGNFTVLHLITSAHALRVLLACIDVDERAPLVRHYWMAYAAGYVAAGMKPAASLDDDDLPGWGEIIEAAIASDDEHVIKLVDSCREQQEAYGDGQGDVWRAAAARAVLQDAPMPE